MMCTHFTNVAMQDCFPYDHHQPIKTQMPQIPLHSLFLHKKTDTNDSDELTPRINGILS